jgi:hypothetical protein
VRTVRVPVPAQYPVRVRLAKWSTRASELRILFGASLLVVNLICNRFDKQPQRSKATYASPWMCNFMFILPVSSYGNLIL